ncbi:MAG: PEP-CTERM sorting domain-containing protein [Pirellulales bacterium]|nr:PEP-CTERM sorting domain-containing protein [Pirellulales bacterium]
MKRNAFRAVSGLAVLLILIASSQATTITFGVAGSHGDNSDVPLDYGSNVAGDSDDFVTTDGTGATPDIALAWAPSPNFWEFHNGANMANNGFDVPVAQMDMEPNDTFATITFTTESDAVALILHSVDMGDATGHDPAAADSTWDLEIIRMSDMQVMKTVQAGPYDETPYVENVRLDFVGELGEDYILKFIDTDGEPKIYTNIDNLSFSQVPEPSTLVLLLTLAGFVALWRRK